MQLKVRAEEFEGPLVVGDDFEDLIFIGDTFLLKCVEEFFIVAR